MYCVHESRLSGGSDVTTLWVGFARVLFSFFVGIVLNRFLTLARVARFPSIPFPVLASALLLVVCVPWKAGMLYDAFAVVVVFPAIILLGAKDCASPLWRRIALRAGGLSYPLYVLHDVTVIPLLEAIRSQPLAVILLAMAGAFVLAVGVSYVAWISYDKPLRFWLSQQRRLHVEVGS